MATSLSANLSATCNFNFTNSLTGSITVPASGGFSYTKAITNGTTAGTCDLIYAIQTTIAGGGNTTLDLAGSLTDWFGTTITFARVNVIFIKLTSDTLASSVSIGNGTNPFINWISAATSTVKILQDGIFLLADTGTTGFAVTAGTGDVLKILNNDGSVTATLQIILLGKSA